MNEKKKEDNYKAKKLFHYTYNLIYVSLMPGEGEFVTLHFQSYNLAFEELEKEMIFKRD